MGEWCRCVCEPHLPEAETQTRTMPGNPEKGMDGAGRGAEKTNMPVLPILFHCSKHVTMCEKPSGEKTAEGLQVTLGKPQEAPQSGENCSPSHKDEHGKKKAVQRKFNLQRKRSCLLNVALC